MTDKNDPALADVRKAIEQGTAKVSLRGIRDEPTWVRLLVWHAPRQRFPFLVSQRADVLT